jgi:hypothetical protein
MSISSYEQQQISEIAGWKSLRPSLLEASLGRLAAAAYDHAGSLVHKTHIGPTLLKAFELAEQFDTVGEIRTLAGVESIDELRHSDLQRCDALVERIALREERLGLTEAAFSEVGGLATEIANMPIQAREVILLLKRIGHCYGYPLNEDTCDSYLKTLIILGHETKVAKRLELLNRLRTLESCRLSDEEIEEENREIETKIGAGFAEGSVMEFVPYFGMLLSVYNDYEYFHHLIITARRVFQERHLRDLGKVDEILPAEGERRESTLMNVAGFARELVYTGSYALGYSGAFLGFGLVRILTDFVPPVGRGVGEGSNNAAHDARTAASHLNDSLKGTLGFASE